jgi:biotin/methionine sulfoxide reductase
VADETLAISPADARERGVKDGEVVRVFNARGACFAGAVITDAVRPGVFRLSCGAWYDPASEADDAPCTHGSRRCLGQLASGRRSAAFD